MRCDNPGQQEVTSASECDTRGSQLTRQNPRILESPLCQQ